MPGLAHRPRNAGQHGRDLAELVRRRHRRQRSARARACPRTARADPACRPDRGSPSSASTAAGSALAADVTTTSPGSVLSTCVRLKNSLAVPRDRHLVARPRPRARADVNTKMPSDVAGFGIGRARRAPAGRSRSTCMPVTMPVVADVLAGERRVSAAALDVVNRRGRGRAAVASATRELRGVGAPIEKSMLLLLESKQPPRLRSAAVVLVSRGRRSRAFEAVRARRSRRDPRSPPPDTRRRSAAVVDLQRDLAGAGAHRDRARSRPARAAARPAGSCRLLDEVVAARRDAAGERRHLPRASAGRRRGTAPTSRRDRPSSCRD